MTHVADDAVLGKFVRRLKGLIERAMAGSLDLDRLWDIVQGYLDGKLEGVEGVLAGTHHVVELVDTSIDLKSFFDSPDIVVDEEFRNVVLRYAIEEGSKHQPLPTFFDSSASVQDARIYCLWVAGQIKRIQNKQPAAISVENWSSRTDCVLVGRRAASRTVLFSFSGLGVPGLWAHEND